MADEMKKHFYTFMRQVNGLHGIIVSDRDGVPIMKVCDEDCPALAAQPAFLSMFGIATEQASKLGLSKNKSIICMYTNYQLVLLNKHPLIVTMIASSSANTGLMLNLEDQLDDAITELKGAVTL